MGRFTLRRGGKWRPSGSEHSRGQRCGPSAPSLGTGTVSLAVECLAREYGIAPVCSMMEGTVWGEAAAGMKGMDSAESCTGASRPGVRGGDEGAGNGSGVEPRGREPLAGVGAVGGGLLDEEADHAAVHGRPATPRARP